MKPETRGEAAVAFNLLQKAGKLPQEALYNFVEGAPGPAAINHKGYYDKRLDTRRPIEKRWREMGVEVASYSESREYVMLWEPDPNGADRWHNLRLVEVGEFIQSARALGMDKGKGRFRGVMT